MIENLDEYGSAFARVLFEAFPWMKEHARCEGASQSGGGSLLVEFSPPPTREHHQLWVSTDGGEVTIGFGMFHTHFDWPSYEDDGEYWEDPLDFLRKLMEDNVLIEDWTREGKWSGSSTLVRGEDPDTEGMESDHIVYVRSWSGKLDRVLTEPL